MKTILILILVVASIQVSAQIEKPIFKGNFIIGGNISGSYTNNISTETIHTYSNNSVKSDYSDAENTDLSFSFSPNIGYFISNGLVAGIKPILSLQRSDRNSNNSSGISNGFSIGTGVYLKYYFQKGFFMNMDIQYLHNKNHTTAEYILQSNTSDLVGKENIVSDDHFNTFGISPGIGYAIFLNSKISFETMISYLYQKQKGPTDSDIDITFENFPENNQNFKDRQTSVDIHKGLYLTVGLNIFLK